MEVVFQEINDDEIRRRLQAAATGNPIDAQPFFNQFDFSIYRKNGQHLEAYTRTIEVLAKLKQLDSAAYEKIHKGNPYYFCAISAFFLRKYVNAVYFFDAAASEDIKNDPDKRTPAILFMEMDGEDSHQNALQLTQLAGSILTEFIDQYNQMGGAIPITLVDIRTKLLTRAVNDHQEWRTLSTSLISYLLEWSDLFVYQEIRTLDGTWEPLFTHLFKGCVLFESLLKANPSVVNPGNTLGNILNQNSGIKKVLGIHRNIKMSDSKFNGVLGDLPSLANNIETSIEMAARLRNTIGHSVVWATSITSAQYVKLVRIVMDAILHTISGLY